MARKVAKDHQDKRSAILKTAARFFAQTGYDRASMNQLATECGVSKALIYHYYSGKEALLFDILEHHLCALLEGVKSVNAQDTTPDAYLRALVAAILASYKGADYEHRLQLDAMTALPADQQAVLADIQKQLVQMVSDAIQKVAPELFVGEPDTLRPVTMSLFGMLNWFFMWYRKGGGITREDYGDLATDMLLGGLKQLSERAR